MLPAWPFQFGSHRPELPHNLSDKQMTRLAILTSAISPYHDARYRAAAQSIEEVVVVSATSEGEFAEFVAERRGDYGVTVLYPGRISYAAAVKSGDIAARTSTCLNELRPDIIAIAGWAAPEGLAALDWARCANIPVILMSESQGDDASRSLVREVVKRRIVSQFDAALVGGPPHLEYVVQLGLVRSRIFLGYNSVDNTHFFRGASVAREHRAELLQAHGLPERYLLASARFIEKKNLPTLIEAYSIARQGAGNVPDLVILGDGAGRGHLESMVADLGLTNNVHLPGFRGYDVLPVYYGLADAFCHVSTSEQWGLVVNEAMAAGLPVIVSQRCGVARTILSGGGSGIVVEPTLEGVTEGLKTVLTMSAQQRTVMGASASEAVASWGPDRFGTGMRAAVDCAIRSPRNSKMLPWDRLLIKQLQKRVFTEVA